ncbi:hypothetical protein, partial [Nocardiopsis sp. NRRL B-16309]|uniref:hypothetical protein n=1 Tax=Nocardiopsis sp. NRRL B-16309 TaxID=1519494 RepID=UPI0009EAC51E
MAHSSPAVLSYAIALLRATIGALFSPARGRHSAARRRRSTRVRRYAPVPAPTQASAALVPRPAPRPASRPAPPASRPAPRLAPPPAPIPAEDVALVRGYYRAFENERDLARVQADALRRLDQWTARPPVGDLLAPVPAPRRPERV